MISKVHVKQHSTWDGISKPDVGDLLLMHNPVFGNDDYTKYYKGVPKDTVYIVVSCFNNLIIRPVISKDVYGMCQSFTCSRGFDKHFRPYTTTKGAIEGLTLD